MLGYVGSCFLFLAHVKQFTRARAQVALISAASELQRTFGDEVHVNGGRNFDDYSQLWHTSRVDTRDVTESG